MRILKKVLIVIAILIAIPLIIALFTKKDCGVEREITINRPNQEVFNYVKYLRNQDKFSKWATMDPNMKQDYRGTDGTVGFVSAWDSEKSDVGQGEQVIKKINEGERVDFALHFIKPMEGKADAYMTTEAVSAKETKVKWGFSSRTAYPMNIMLLFMDMEEMIGNDLQTGLNNLKRTLEKQ